MSVPLLELKAVYRVWVGPGEMIRLPVQIPVSSLALVGPDGERAVLPGEYRVHVGGCAPLEPLGPLQRPLEGIFVVEPALHSLP